MGAHRSENMESESNQDKTYDISVAAGKTIKMTFAAFSLENAYRCGWDYLMIVDGNGNTVLDKSCGSTMPYTGMTVTSQTNKAKVIFHSDYSVTSSGFKIDWVAV